jgi:hypothetical protein
VHIASSNHHGFKMTGVSVWCQAHYPAFYTGKTLYCSQSVGAHQLMNQAGFLLTHLFRELSSQQRDPQKTGLM